VFPADIGERARASWQRMAGRPDQRRPRLAETAQRMLLDAYAPASALIDSSYRAIYLSGATDRYFQMPAGEPNQDALAMLRDGLASRFRAAARQAAREQAPVTVSGARMERNGDEVLVSITARPVQHDGQQLLLVSLVDEPERQAVEIAEKPAEISRVAELEHQLEETREELETTIRELEDANQELSAANEEARSVNEEYQSANEELETSKEELQSLNEELTTTNNQLHETLERQRRTSDDLQNILNSSDAATLFLDEDLNIRFFTPSAGSRFGFIPSDVGRPLANFANPFPGIDLLADARSVLANLTTIRHEVKSASDTWYWYRTSPYRTQDNRIEGVVISLGDISEMKAVEQETRAARAYAEAIIDTINEPLVVLDGDMRVVSASRSFFRYFRASPEDTIGRLLPDTERAPPGRSSAARVPRSHQRSRGRSQVL
jgi:two-component system, chemotaxis family, CheB/CheR fusion protein